MFSTIKLFIFISLQISMICCKLYGMNVQATRTNIEQFGVSIDFENAQCKNITEIASFTDETFDVLGISTFDQRRGDYYYAVDFVLPLIYSFNAFTGRLNPTLFIEEIANVADLSFNSQTSTLYVLGLTNQTTGATALFSFSMESQITELVTVMPSNLYFNYIAKTAVNEQKNLFYVIANTQLNAFAYAVLTIDLNSGSILSRKLISPGQTFIPQYSFYDASLQMIVGGQINSISPYPYGVYTLNPNTGAITSTLFPSTSSDVCDPWAYDYKNQIMHFFGNYFYTYDFNKKKLSTTPLSNCLPQNMVYSER